MFEAESIVHVNLHEQVVEGLALVLGPCGDFADETDGSGCVLVANLVVGEESKAFLAATDILLLAFGEGDFACNPLEAGVAVADFNSFLLGNIGDALGGHDGLHQEVGALKLAEVLLVLDDVIAEHEGGLVAVENHPFALVVAADDGEAVGIGVGGYYQVSVELRSELHAEGHGLCVFRVGAYDGGEVSVHYHLLGHYVDVLESPAAEAEGHNDAARTVHGGVDDVEVLLTVDDVLVDEGFVYGGHVVEVHLTTDNLDEVPVGFELHVLDGHLVHFFDDAGVMGGKYLCTVLPIGLVTVVFLGVVAGGDVYTGLGTQLADGK